jgi:hypothetical protein
VNVNESWNANPDRAGRGGVRRGRGELRGLHGDPKHSERRVEIATRSAVVAKVKLDVGTR